MFGPADDATDAHVGRVIWAEKLREKKDREKKGDRENKKESPKEKAGVRAKYGAAPGVG